MSKYLYNNEFRWDLDLDLYRKPQKSKSCNMITDFYGTDNEEKWKTNCKKSPDSDMVKYYKKNPIEYRHNNYGFRTPDDFNDVDIGNVFLGDSFTFGIGLRLEDLWSYKLSQKLGGKCWNLGQPGTSIGTAVRLMLGWKDYLKIDKIFHLINKYRRFEVMKPDNSGVFTLASYNKRVNFYDMKDYSYSWRFFVDVLSQDPHWHYYCESNLYTLKGIANELGCEYYPLYVDFKQDKKIIDKFINRQEDFINIPARDTEHRDTGTQLYFYEKFLEML